MQINGSRLELIGTMYLGRIKKSNGTRGALIFENGLLSFWPSGADRPTFERTSPGIFKVTLMPNGINLKIEDKKFAFLPNDEKHQDIGMGVFSLDYDMIDIITQNESQHVKLFNRLKEHGYKCEDKGLIPHFKLNLILSGVILFGSLLITLIVRM